MARAASYLHFRWLLRRPPWPARWSDDENRWAVAKLVRHQALDLAFEGSSPSRPAISNLMR
jgi:hypothetical protein